MSVVYLYLSFDPKMIKAKIRVIPLAKYTGILWLNNPYSSHSKVPNVNSAYMERDMLDVSFERMVLTACGKKEKVVQPAASRPIKVINCTNKFFANYSFHFYFREKSTLSEQRPHCFKIGKASVIIGRFNGRFHSLYGLFL